MKKNTKLALELMKKAAAKVKCNKYFIVKVLYQMLIIMNSDLCKMPIAITVCKYWLFLPMSSP